APTGKKVKFGEDGSSKDVSQRPSTLLSEEVDFPRGGGTTLEELNKPADATAMEVDGQAVPGKTKKRAEGGKKDKKGKQKGDTGSGAKGDTIRVEHLNYKRLEAGQRLLGQITSILPLALIVSLPNQLMGHVPIINISSQLTSRLESTPSSSSEAEESEEEEGDGVPSLSQVFKPGQYVSCTVKQVRPASSTIDFGAKPRDEEEKAARRVELSIRPNEVNTGVGAGDLRAGFNITGAIQSVEDHGYVVDLGIPDVSGFIPYKDKSKPDAKRLSVGQVVSSTVVKLSENKRLCTLSTSPNAVQSACLTEATSANALLPGALVSALVTAVVPSGLNLQVLGYFGGTVELFHLPGGTDSAKEGDKVLSVNPDRSRILLTLKKSLLESTLPILATFDDAKVGMVTSGVVQRIEERFIILEYYGGVKALVPLNELTDTQVSSTSGLFTIGQVVKSRITSVDKEQHRLTASIRQAAPSFQGPVDISKVQVGSTVSGAVSAVHDENVVLSLEDPEGGRALLSVSNLANARGTTVPQLRSSLEQGERIEGLSVMSVNTEKALVIVSAAKPKDKAKTKTGTSNALRIDALEEGQVVSGRITQTMGTGIGVRLSSHVVGRLHSTDVADDYTGPLAAPPAEGSVVDVAIVRIDKGLKRVDVSMRKSRLEPGAKHKIVDREIQSIEDLKVGGKVRGMVKSVVQHGLFVMLGRDLDARIQIKELFDEYVKDWQSRFSVGQVVETRVLAVNPETNQIELTMRSGDINKLLKRTVGLSDFQVGQKVEGRVKSVMDFGIFIEIAGTKISGLCHKSEDLTADLHTKVPESTADFERVLLGSPNSSYLWIQYMSFQLQLSEVDKAREIGRRALQTINYREEQEKLNVWIALLNLENQFGTEESLEALFKDAARHNDSKTVHLRMAAIFDESEKTQKAEEQFARTAKKFSQSSKAWTLFGEHYLKAGKLEESRKLLARSLLSLPQRKHLKTISTFARMEYKLGDPERGKTIFEGIVESHPKRNDLWSMYIDMESSQNNAQSVRNIFNRALARKLTAKQAKFFFKKWLEVEKRIGDEAGAEAVKEKAVSWMQAHAGPSEES
ncbi:rRNA biogenesis protein rrp5, partial [Ceratobasidium sp. 423]